MTRPPSGTPPLPRAERETVADTLAADWDTYEAAAEHDYFRRLGRRRPQDILLVAYLPGQTEPCGVARLRKAKR